MQDRGEHDVASAAAAAYLRLQLLPPIGPLRGRRAVERVGSVHDVFRAPLATLLDVEGMSRPAATGIRNDDGQAVRRELTRVARLGARVICLEDPEYPQLLREIPDAPLCLYVLGSLDSARHTCLAVVGSRNCTFYGREQACCLGMAAARCGMVVVSGLARGVDHAAHCAALDCDAPTIAVVACGLEQLPHHAHAGTARRIAAHGGAVLTEYALHSVSTPRAFPRRNRLIAGLSVGTLIVEAARRSGALITARLAAEYNREVFAVPGRVDTPSAWGANALIQRGEAKLVMTIDDVLTELQHVLPQIRHDYAERGQRVMSAVRLDPEELAVLEILDLAGVGIEAICRCSGLAPEKIARTLVTLQLKGVVEQLPGNRFARRYAETQAPTDHDRGGANE